MSHVNCSSCIQRPGSTHCEGCWSSFCPSCLEAHHLDLDQKFSELNSLRESLTQSIYDIQQKGRNKALLTRHHEIDLWEREMTDRIRKVAINLRRDVHLATEEYVEDTTLKFTKTLSKFNTQLNNKITAERSFPHLKRALTHLQNAVAAARPRIRIDFAPSYALDWNRLVIVQVEQPKNEEKQFEEVAIEKEQTQPEVQVPPESPKSSWRQYLSRIQNFERSTKPPEGASAPTTSNKVTQAANIPHASTDTNDEPLMESLFGEKFSIQSNYFDRPRTSNTRLNQSMREKRQKQPVSQAGPSPLRNSYAQPPPSYRTPRETDKERRFHSWLEEMQNQKVEKAEENQPYPFPSSNSPKLTKTPTNKSTIIEKPPVSTMKSNDIQPSITKEITTDLIIETEINPTLLDDNPYELRSRSHSDVSSLDPFSFSDQKTTVESSNQSINEQPTMKASASEPERIQESATDSWIPNWEMLQCSSCNRLDFVDTSTTSACRKCGANLVPVKQGAD